MDSKVDYGPGFQFLVTEDVIENYPQPNQPSGMRNQLAECRLESVFPMPIQNSAAANACLSGIWLLHNYLDESHEISQSLPTPEGSWWHAIMHRLEGDFGNSKYWYRSVGSHPVFQAIGTQLGQTEWDPATFVDDCRNQTNQTDSVARIEWSCLFHHCFQLATGRAEH